MSKTSKIDRAIEVLKAERAVLDLAISKLEAQNQTRPAAKPRTVSVKPRPLAQE